MSWFQQLQRASFSGVPFGVLGGQLKVGRRNAVHEYPFKDEVWVEDLGRAARRITLVGFLVENGVYLGGASGDVLSQRERMIAACESGGQTTLVHPTLGSLQVTLDVPVTFTESRDRGRMFEIAFSFIEAGARVFPSSDADTGAAVSEACTLADAAAGADFSAVAALALPAGASVVEMATSTAGTWGSTALSLASDATNLMNSVGSLPGTFGRFFGGRIRDMAGSIVGGGDAFSTIDSLIAVGSAARELVSTSVAALGATAASLGIGSTGAFAAAAQAVAAALLGSTIDPADSIRVLASLSIFSPSAPTPSSAVGASMANMQDGCGDLFRRAAVVSVARGSVSYQPASFDDAVRVRTQLTSLLDAEIVIAGDKGQDATYGALRSVRAAVVQDLTARGANLATLTTINSARPMPSLVLAQRAYRDASRAEELVVQSGCVHPSFMPVSFKALSK